MSLEVPDRVHVVPLGYEDPRAVDSVVNFKADRVVLICHNNDDKPATEFRKQVVSELDRREIPCEERECDIFELFSCLSAISQTIHDHQSDEVYVNVSTGSKITAIAGTIASMVMGSTPYYARADYYSDGRPKGISEVYELPRYPVNSPDTAQNAVLEYVRLHQDEYAEGPTKGRLINFCERNQFEFILSDVAGKAKYRILDTHILDPLKSQNYIQMIKDGRNRRVRLTDHGQSANEAFRYLLPDDIEWKNPNDSEGNSSNQHSEPQT
jgi:hypothetical protein